MEGEKAWVEAIATEARIMERREWFMVGERIQGNKIRVDHCIDLFLVGVSVRLRCGRDAVVTVGRPAGRIRGKAASTQKGGKVADFLIINSSICESIRHPTPTNEGCRKVAAEDPEL
jgi:hypothetical protein